MRIFPGERRAGLSVGELADFGLGPRSGSKGPSGAWRAELGREWHYALRTESEIEQKGTDEVRHEVTVRGVLLRGGWTIEMDGRVDKLRETNDQVLATELKTTFFPLPATDERLREKYPHYFLQVAAYLVLLRLLPEYTGKPVAGELRFADVSGGGFIQTVPADTRDEAALEERFAELLAFLEERRSSRQRLSTLIIKPPFDALREGQAEASATLEETFAVAPITLFEAPTGFGKTGISLSFALERLRAGLCDRILYLTGKSTGQNEVVRTLRKMIPNEGSLRYLCLRNRIERNAGFEEFDNLSRDELACRWKTADLAPVVLFRGGTIPEEILREEAIRIGISPYEIFRACLPFADLLVGDFNYAFHPGSTALLKGVNDFVPARTLLMADEGHNLPERTASGLSARFSAGDARGATEALGFGHGPKILTRALEDWVEFLEARRKNEVLDADDFYRATDLVETVAEAIRKGPLPRENLAVSELETLWRFEEAARLLEADDLPKRLWAPENGSIEIMCLDAAAYIGTEIRTYGLCLLASATLSPMKEFATACGLQPEEYRSVKGAAPWRSGALRAAIDLRVDTRLVCRYRHLDATATAVLSLIQSSAKPVVVFFPSFRYAGEASAKLREISSSTRVVLQPRFGSLGEANEFLAAALSRSDALLLVLGSVFSEGIDSLGGEVDTAMIVGPALPEVNPLQEAKMETLAHMGREEAFRRTYLIPGMRKVNQALGRLARAPEHRARIILHCRRFAQPAYRALLDPVCREAPNLRSSEEMRTWLAAEENTVALPS